MGRRKKVNAYGFALPTEPTPIEPMTTDAEVDAISAMSGENWRDFGMTQYGIDCKRMFIREELEVTKGYRATSARAWGDAANKYYGHKHPAYFHITTEREFLAAALLEGVPMDYENKEFKLRFKAGRKMFSYVKNELIRKPVINLEVGEKFE